MKTKTYDKAMEFLRVKLGCVGKLVVNSVGRCEELCLLWSGKVTIDLISYLIFRIDAKIVSHGGKVWQLTGFYSNPVAEQRCHGWNLLQHLVRMSQLHWLYVEDLNKILNDEEKHVDVFFSRRVELIELTVGTWWLIAGGLTVLGITIKCCTNTLAMWNSSNGLSLSKDIKVQREELRRVHNEPARVLPRDDVEEVLGCLEPLLSQRAMASLEAKFSPEEIRKAVYDMGLTKALDDGLLFVGASLRECMVISRILEVYSRASGQLANFDKSGMCVSRSMVWLRELQRVCSSFWWGSSEAKRKIHWGSWKKLFEGKPSGGLRFRDLKVSEMSLEWSSKISYSVALVASLRRTCLSSALRCGVFLDYLRANIPTVECTYVEAGVIRWKPPSDGFYKVNINASLDVANHGIGIGLVIRDHQGFVMASSSQRLEVCFSPQIAEAMAIKRGIQFAFDTGLVLVVVESDALSVVKMVNAGRQILLPTLFSKLALKSSEDLFWLETYPLSVEEYVMGDFLVTGVVSF
ncbi:hypothetical protein Dsin_019600 [Dipteronia sinensis]|uniref:RNase H type-1 domain-containing protein n=1 Tax=Dipteronia sinensis TaxID=43782 RepID=A0AAE0A895_9ROSI|nr:hypothetical protein Dsin_019600 [Dipteronia sinensis]